MQGEPAEVRLRGEFRGWLNGANSSLKQAKVGLLSVSLGLIRSYGVNHDKKTVPLSVGKPLLPLTTTAGQ